MYEMQMQFFVVLSTFLDVLNAVYLNYEDEVTKRWKHSLDNEFKPILISKKYEKISAPSKNFNCDEFPSYAVNCTVDAAFIYNSSRMSLPHPTKINDWCRAIKHLTNCAIDWNTDCKDVTETRFNEESIKGHIHVLNNICDDEWFLMRYEEITECIEESSDQWESCYLTFKDTVEEQKNSTSDWTHYEVHFKLCCARAQFRRCTLDSVFSIQGNCVAEQGLTLQKFSVVVSEGSVYQVAPFTSSCRVGTEFIPKECDRNMMYENCPDGDPRPTGATLKRIMRNAVISSTPSLRCQIPIYLPMITLLFPTV